MDELLQDLQAIQDLNNARVDFQKSLALLRALKAGNVCLDQVALAGDGWQLVPLAASGPQAVAIEDPDAAAPVSVATPPEPNPPIPIEELGQ